MQLWYQRLGFYSNPFSIKPAQFDHMLFGGEGALKDVLDRINTGNIIFIHGPYGTGKTTMLKRIISEFSGSKRLVYYSCNSTDRRINIEKLLTGRYGLVGKLLGIKPTGMVLLLDEVQDLSGEDEHEVLKYYREGYLFSVVLVSKTSEARISDEMKKIIGYNFFTTSPLTDQDAIRMIRRRIGMLPLLSDETIRHIARLSGYNPRLVLENCEDVCRMAIEWEMRHVSPDDAGHILRHKSGAEASQP